MSGDPTQSGSRIHRYGMSRFFHWLEHRDGDAIPDATTVALMISRAGATGVSLDELRRKTGLALDTLDEFLEGLLAAGQVVLSKINGRLAYRAGI